ncbi:MAG: SPFH domain-containing protein [Candidatus Binatia bacterium]
MRTLLIAVLVILAGVFAFWPHTTGPTEVGVRIVKWDPLRPSGVLPDVYSPGALYFFPAVLNSWKVLDTKLHNLEMTFDPTRGDRNYRDDLLFKTIDGNDISLDVIVTWRIDPLKAPYIVQYVAPNNFELQDKVVRTIVRSRPRDIFGELKTEEFYLSDKRDAKAEQAKQALSVLLNPFGIIVERVSTKDYRFNPAYQKAIEDKKIAEQVAEQNKSATKAAEEEWLRKLEEAKGEVNKIVAITDGQNRQAQIQADAYFAQQGNIASAIEAEGRADAKGITELNKAMTGSGGEVMVKLKLAEALSGKRILLLPLAGGGLDIKTTNINQLLEAYGAQSLAGGTR